MISRFDSLFFARYLSPGQTPVMVAHRHLFSIVDDMILWLFFAVILPVFFYYYGSFGLRELFEPWQMGAWIALIYVFLMYRLFDMYNDVWIFTEHGVVDLDWSLLSANVIFIEYSSVHGVETRKNGFMDNILNRGDIEVHLADTDEVFLLADAARPDDVRDFLQNSLTHGHDHSDDHGEKNHANDDLVRILSEIVRDHLDKRGTTAEQWQESDYRHRLQKALKHGATIDLREHTEEDESSVESTGHDDHRGSSHHH